MKGSSIDNNINNKNMIWKERKKEIYQVMSLEGLVLLQTFLGRKFGF